MERNVIGSSRSPIRKLTLICIALASLLGCGNDKEMPFGPQAIFPAPDKPAPIPIFGEDTSLALIHNDDRLSVGSPARGAIDFYPRPSKAFEFTDRPPGFGPEFRTTGWASQSEGFGLIFYQDRVAVALREYYSLSPDQVAEVVDAYSRLQARESLTEVKGMSVQYYFWEQARHRLMICVVSMPDKPSTVTIGLGEIQLMNELRMSPIAAVADKNRAENALQDLKQKPTE